MINAISPHAGAATSMPTSASAASEFREGHEIRYSKHKTGSFPWQWTASGAGLGLLAGALSGVSRSRGARFDVLAGALTGAVVVGGAVGLVTQLTRPTWTQKYAERPAVQVAVTADGAPISTGLVFADKPTAAEAVKQGQEWLSTVSTGGFTAALIRTEDGRYQLRKLDAKVADIPFANISDPHVVALLGSRENYGLAYTRGAPGALAAHPDAFAALEPNR